MKRRRNKKEKEKASDVVARLSKLPRVSNVQQPQVSGHTRSGSLASHESWIDSASPQPIRAPAPWEIAHDQDQLSLELLTERQNLGFVQLKGDIGADLAKCRDTMRKELETAKGSMRNWCIGILVAAVLAAIMAVIGIQAGLFDSRLARVEEDIHVLRESVVRIETKLETAIPTPQGSTPQNRESP